ALDVLAASAGDAIALVVGVAREHAGRATPGDQQHPQRGPHHHAPPIASDAPLAVARTSTVATVRPCTAYRHTAPATSATPTPAATPATMRSVYASSSRWAARRSLCEAAESSIATLERWRK